MKRRGPSGVAGVDPDHFFDTVYLESTLPLISPEVTDAEAALLARLLSIRPGSRVLDLGCGHGRHAAALAARGAQVVGLDRSWPALRMAVRSCPDLTLVRGDFRALPFADGSFDAAYCWYSGLFLYDPLTHRRILEGIGRTLRPGGLLLLDQANPRRLEAQPVAEHVQRLPAGQRLFERCRFDPERSLEQGLRRIERADGSVIEARWQVWLPGPEELEALLRRTGFELDSLLDEGGRPFDPGRSLDLVALARRPVAAACERRSRRSPEE
ncbi:MAG: class I SAM-dependent methyltransferase [Deltaproteobacteria bacterium]|nr:MAG: class I SAM-dependent methyltransferase [Deltaproteobacteria bacterium]